MTPPRQIRRAPWVAAAAVGAASIGYLIRVLPTGQAGMRVGVWDVMIAVVTEPRFLVVVCLTVALIATVLRREPVLPELIRLGSWRAYLAREAGIAVHSMLPSILLVLMVCFIGATAAGLPWLPVAPRTFQPGLPGPIGVAAQLLLVIVALTVLHLALTALRVVTGSIAPVVATAVAMFGWSGISVLALVTTITPGPRAGQPPEIAQILAANAAAGLNTITYLDLPFALHSGLHVVAIGLGATTAAAFAAVSALDLRAIRARRESVPAALQHADQP